MKLPTLHCYRCGHTWVPNVPNPQRCASRNCRSPYYRTPRKEKGEK